MMEVLTDNVRALLDRAYTVKKVTFEPSNISRGHEEEKGSLDEPSTNRRKPFISTP
jgi:hypothetical protein